MKLVEVQELSGPALDWAVAKCEGYIEDYCSWLHEATVKDIADSDGYHPSVKWGQGGPIIEREEIALRRNAPCSKGREWEASPSILAKGAGGKFGYGPTLLIAAMRCYLASKVGTHIELPE